MKKKVLNILQVIPFCVPVPYILICIDYYFGLHIALYALALGFIAGIAAVYGAKGKLPQVAAGSAVGSVLSVILAALTKGSFDGVFFKPFTAVSFTVIISVVFYVMSVGNAGLLKLVKKQKSKKEKIK